MKNFTSIVYILIQTVVLAQSPKVELSVEPKTADVGEIITITVKSNVQGQVEIDNLPSAFVHGYDVINGMEQEMDHATGDVITYYYLSQTGAFGKTGKYTIGPAFVKKGNKSYKSNKVTITIADKTQMSSGAVTADQLQEPAFGVIQTNKSTIYEGEPILVSAKVYAKFNPSHLDGYRTYDMVGVLDKNPVGNPSRIVVEPTTFKGVRLYAFEYDKNIVFPSGTGVVKITPYTMNLHQGYKSFTFTSNHKTITIKPLPADPPNDFIGAVGNFTVKRSIDAASIKQGDVFKLKIIVSGVGNLQNILEPTPKLPKGFVIYGDPLITENYSYCSHGTEGNISFEYNIQVTTHGDVEFPATSISYFDLNSEKYITTSTESSRIAIEKDKNYIVSEDANEPNTASEEISVLSDVRPSKINTSNNEFFGTVTYWSAVSAPMLAAFLFLLFMKRREKSADVIEHKQEINKKGQELKDSQLKLKVLLASSDDVTYFSTLESTLKKAFEVKMEFREDRILDKQEIYTFVETNYSQTFLDQVKMVFTECEQFRYGFGASNQNKEKHYNELNAIIQQLKV